MDSNVPVFVPLTRPADGGKVEGMLRAFRPLAVFAALLFLVSCGEQLGYQDHVRVLLDARAHPLLLELLPLFGKPSARNPDDLVRTWKEFLGESPVPLRRDSEVTFVYYDFSGTRSQVWLEASFSPGRREALTKVAGVGLFYKVYDIPRAHKLKYRFSDGAAPLHDPFNADVEVGNDSWHAVPDVALATERWISGATEPLLGVGRDVRVVLPPLFDRELAQTYPLAVISDLDGWTTAAAELLNSGTVKPFVAVSAIDDQTLAWLQSHFRLNLTPPFKWQGSDADTMVAALKAQFSLPVVNP